MKNSWFILSLAAIPFFASAELEIEPLSGNRRFEKRLENMRSAVNNRSAKAADFPTFEQFNEAVSHAKSQSAISQKKLALPSPSRIMVENLKCTLENQAPSGVAKKDGELNGVMSVYLCTNGYMVAYENDYQAPLTQRVIVFDDDFAKKQDPTNPLIKEAVTTRGNTRFTSLRWLNPQHEIRYEVFTNLHSTEDARLEKSLKEGLKEIAIQLSTSS